MALVLARLRGLIQRKQLFPAQQIIRSWPANIKEKDKDFFALNRKYLMPQSWLLKLRKVNLYWDGLVFHGLHFHLETLVLPHDPQHNYRGLLYMYLRMPCHKLHVGTKYLLAHDEWALNYYHWLVDSLPRLLSVREQLPSMTLLLPENCTTDYHQHTLRALGVTKIEYLKPKVRYVVPDLLVPTRLARVASYNPVVMRELRQVLIAKFPPLLHAMLGERLYISRAQATRRKIINEEEVIEYLRTQGFVIVELESYTFPEQVSIMAQVSCLVSIHGAGLTNMLFMPLNGRVLELQMQDDGSSHYYYTLSAALGLDYYYQFCSPEDASMNVQNANLLVDMIELKKNISLMLTD